VSQRRWPALAALNRRFRWVRFGDPDRPVRKADMTSPASSNSRPAAPRWPLALAAAALWLVAPVASAQYKVIGADGKVTYTDREPNGAEGRVTALGARVPAQPAEPDLPFELRQASTKYPVTLYTTNGACDPCVQGRQLLKQRGVPFSERQAVSNDDIDALEKISGGREAPTLTVGAQVLRGFASDSWNQYLDAAGYPRESRLPASYQYRPAVPILDRREPALAAGGAAAPAPVNRPAPTAPPGPSGGIRF
jgi:glutaredoxin